MDAKTAKTIVRYLQMKAYAIEPYNHFEAYHFRSVAESIIEHLKRQDWRDMGWEVETREVLREMREGK